MVTATPSATTAADGNRESRICLRCRRSRWRSPQLSAIRPVGPTKVAARDVNVFYAEKQALKNVTVGIPEKAVTAFIGPSGCGKSTFLRCLNRMNDTIPIARVTGTIDIDGENVNDPKVDPVELRARVGMVFQKPNPFPKSIFENIAYGARIHGLARTKAEFDDLVELSLKRAGLWEEVKDRLHERGPDFQAANSNACASPAPSP